MEGRLDYHGVDLYAKDVNPVEVRRRIGMVFQKPNPFPKSIFENVAYGPKLAGIKKKAELDEIVERALRGAAIWDEVKDRLHKSGLGLSGGQRVTSLGGDTDPVATAQAVASASASVVTDTALAVQAGAQREPGRPQAIACCCTPVV